MSAPRIKVRLGHSPVLRKIHNAWVNQGWLRKFYWHCTGCTPSQFESNGGTADTLAAAADAGRAHLAEHHAQGYCRLHGVHRSVCGCQVAPVDPDAVKVAHNVSCDHCNDLCDYCGEMDGVCDRDFSCCNPIQRTYDTSREDC